jgi:hypothetical protein
LSVIVPFVALADTRRSTAAKKYLGCEFAERFTAKGIELTALSTLRVFDE